MRVAVYSGSFNPMHIGHLEIVRYLTGDAGFDRVYLIVSPQNPFKDASNARSGPARYEAAKAVMGRYPELDVMVDDIELRMDPPHYTIRTLDALKAREPENEFVVVMGADNLDVIRQWKDYRRILTEYGIAVFPRRGSHRGRAKASLLRENPSYNITLLNKRITTISSSFIRAGLAEGKDMSRYLA